MNMVKRKIHLLDVRKSRISTEEIKEYKDQITKQKNNPVCDALSTVEVAAKGAEAMRKDGFHLLEGQLDV